MLKTLAKDFQTHSQGGLRMADGQIDRKTASKPTGIDAQKDSQDHRQLLSCHTPMNNYDAAAALTA